MTHLTLKVKRKIHTIAGCLAGLVIFSFFLSTLLVETLGTRQDIAQLKNAIVFPGLFILVPLLAITGGLGRAMMGSTSSAVLVNKMKRMKIIAALGITVLIPCAIMLSHMASKDNFGTLFTVIQIIEILAGATNLTLIILNARDGVLLTKSRRQKVAISTKIAREKNM